MIGTPGHIFDPTTHLCVCWPHKRILGGRTEVLFVLGPEGRRHKDAVMLRERMCVDTEMVECGLTCTS